MDFKDNIRQLAERVGKLKEQIMTEEATKNAFIMPFLQMLGYDVFNPLEVIPEMDCDLIKKKGEKIDYAIMKDGMPIMLFECKHWQQDLSLHDTQLQKYFVASQAKFGVLTNGIKYRFYTDLVKPNIMDDSPFLEIDMENLKDTQVEEVKKFHKSYFDLDNILSTASELKYISALKNALRQEFANPTPEFVKMMTKRVYDGMATQKVLEQFTALIKTSISTYFNDLVAEKLNMALMSTNADVEKEEEPNEKVEEQPMVKPAIETTDEEKDAFLIIKAICREVLAAERITYRDAASYFAIFADDNNRKPICRLYFNSANKQIGVFGEDKTETKFKIESLDDIFKIKTELIESAKKYA